MKTFGERIRERRLQKQMTLEDVAKKSGTSRSYVCGIETGMVNPPLPSKIKKFARVLDLDLDSMLIMAWAEKAPSSIRSRVLEAVKKLVDG